MAHGTADPVVAYEYGHRSAEMLKDKMNIPVHWKSYSGMPHSSCNEELMDVLSFIEKQVPPQ
jgi:predicted esterase